MEIHYLQNRNKVNYLILFLNRVYFFLTKFNNQSPLLGASILVTLLLFFNIGNVILLIYSTSKNYSTVNLQIGIPVLFLIFFLLYTLASKKKKQVRANVNNNNYRDSFVVLLFMATTVLFVYLTNINRVKINQRSEDYQLRELRKESFEEKINRWFQE